MQRSEFLKLLQEELMLDEPLTGSETLSELSWDSMNALSFVALADSKLGVGLTGDQLASCKTVNDLLATVAAKLQ